MPLPLVAAFLQLATAATTPKADPAVTRAELEEVVRFLASDELAGRFTGSPQAMQAAAFLASGLERAGVAPGGDDGTFLQRVPMLSGAFETLPKLTVWDASGETSELVLGIDFDWSGGVPTGKRLRLRPVSKDEEMLGFSDDEVALFLDGSMTERRRWLGEKRGVGFGLVIAPGSDKPGDAAETKPPRIGRLSATKDALPPASIRARGKFLEALRAGTIKALRVDGKVVIEDKPAANVVGVVRGAGTKDEPGLADEVLVFSAHYDHIGLDERATNTGEDRIFNGADDDASGCAAVMELAQAFGAGPKPARTLVFFFATGEEIGLVGTNHYLEAPLFPLARTVCNLNFEMIGRPDDLAGGAGKLWLTGDERSNLGAEFRALQLSIVPDPRLEQRFFERSDNYAFARRGIVAQTLSSYNLHRDYHQVDDEVERIDFTHMEGAVRAGLEAARALADGRVDPRWSEGGDPSKPAKK